MSELVIVRTKPPKGATCYISHFVSEVHERKGGKVLVDFPTVLDHRERRWVSARRTLKV